MSGSGKLQHLTMFTNKIMVYMKCLCIAGQFSTDVPEGPAASIFWGEGVSS